MVESRCIKWGGVSWYVKIGDDGDKDIRIKYSNSDLVDEVNDYLKNNTP